MSTQARQTIGIIGCGRMGAALAGALSRAGLPVLLASRRTFRARELALSIANGYAGTPEWVARNCDIVVLATPAAASCGELAVRLRPLIGSRPVVDVSNPGLDGGIATDCPAAAAIARALDSSCVVKALNCVAAGWLDELADAGPAITVPIASDDAHAKQQVADVLHQLGFDVADAGPLCNSGWIEALAELLANLGTVGGVRGAAGFHLVRRVQRRPAVLGDAVGLQARSLPEAAAQS